MYDGVIEISRFLFLRLYVQIDLEKQKLFNCYEKWADKKNLLLKSI